MMQALAHAERRIPALAVVEVGFLVGRRRPIDELPAEKQKQIRQAYDDTDFCPDACLELFGFYTDLAAAQEAASRYPGGLVMSLPVNGCLPDELGRYGIQLSNSPNGKRLEETSPGLMKTNGLDREQAEKLSRDLKERVRELAAIAS
jgi:hypothetical protein